MKFNPEIHNRRSIRLKGYDYSRAGLYFVTICCQGRVSYFGKIENGELRLNDAGKMIEKWYHKLENKYHDIRCHEMVVMPNHFHFIVENVGADLRVCPNNKTGEPNGTIDETKIGETKTIMGEHNPTMGEHNPTMGEHVGSPLPTVVQWFKTMTTNEYIRGVKTLGWQPFDGKLWQRNYWEHIIRNEQSYQRIANYIIENPKNWKQDKFFEE